MHMMSAQVVLSTCSYYALSRRRRLKNRDTTVICWELLRALARGPQLPSRLSRVANVPYDRLGDYLGLLMSGGLVKAEPAQGHEMYAITPKEMEGLNHLDSGLRMLFPAFE